MQYIELLADDRVVSTACLEGCRFVLVDGQFLNVDEIVFCNPCRANRVRFNNFILDIDWVEGLFMFEPFALKISMSTTSFNITGVHRAKL